MRSRVDSDTTGRRVKPVSACRTSTHCKYDINMTLPREIRASARRAEGGCVAQPSSLYCAASPWGDTRAISLPASCETEVRLGPGGCCQGDLPAPDRQQPEGDDLEMPFYETVFIARQDATAAQVE